MIFWQIFIQSLKLPSKQAVFKLNRTGMDVTVFYMFFLIGLVSIPSIISLFTEQTGFTKSMNAIFRLIYVFIFSYLPLTIIIFLVLCGIAYFGVGIAKGMRRKLRFSILWKMSAYTTTIPFLLYTVMAMIIPIKEQWLWLFVPFTLVLLTKIISIYPKRKMIKK